MNPVCLARKSILYNLLQAVYRLYITYYRQTGQPDWELNLVCHKATTEMEIFRFDHSFIYGGVALENSTIAIHAEVVSLRAIALGMAVIMKR